MFIVGAAIITTVIVVFFLSKIKWPIFSQTHPENSDKISVKKMMLEDSVYERKNFLTLRERLFFKKLSKQLKPEYCLLSQVRVADIIKPVSRYPFGSKEYLALFRQISQWHVDFAILDKESFEIAMVIELDDKTYQQPKRKKRDEILNKAFQQSGVFIYRAMSYDEILASKRIKEFLNEQ
ncbi:DUF2726 domain-containing protein [Salmonella enterica subsp. enterica serovar Javiana]|nr:DUF2726 domain-containing protein [Salmonella enterica]EDR8063847.1 DUF2726 domain-containing protein [Salmonella enterica subsp. enterica serovar Javiana]